MREYTVACVLKSGGDFKPEHVERLRRQVMRHSRWCSRFVCLSDVEINCDTIRLKRNLPGWLSKLELFQPALSGPVLYLDLDTSVVGCIDGLMDHDHEFTMLSDLYKPEIAASGVMAWRGDYSYLNDKFDTRMIPFYQHLLPNRGDCGWITETLGFVPERLQALFPGKIVSYKRNVLPDGLSRHAALVCFHGKPRPWDVKDAWVNA